jgi:hypothetical protein
VGGFRCRLLIAPPQAGIGVGLLLIEFLVASLIESRKRELGSKLNIPVDAVFDARCKRRQAAGWA